MKRVLILGAQNPLAQCVIRQFLDTTNATLSVFCTRSVRFSALASHRLRMIEGSVSDTATLVRAMRGQDVVVANPEGDVSEHANNVVQAMHAARLHRLVYISWVGVYDELARERHDTVLNPHLAAANTIESSNLEYTIVRPAWPTDHDEIDYIMTPKGEPFKGPIISRKSVSSLVVKLCEHDMLDARRNIGVSKAS